jgi:hypothetical protein
MAVGCFVSIITAQHYPLRHIQDTRNAPCVLETDTIQHDWDLGLKLVPEIIMHHIAFVLKVSILV